MPDVAIVGGGPAGLAAALALARLGVDVELYEAADAPHEAAAASTIHPPTLEMFAEWNMLADALDQGLRVHRMQYRDLRDDIVLGELDYDTIADITPYPYRLQLSQPRLEAILVDHIRRSKPTSVQYGATVVAIESREEHIALTLQIAETTDMVFAKYVLAADGAASFVRTSLGLRFLGKGQDARYLLVGTDLDLQKYRPGITEAAFLCDPDDAAEIVPLPGCLHALFPLHPDESEKEALHIPAVGRRLGLLARAEIERVEIHHYAVYGVQARIAEKFRSGNVFLLGDAAHVSTPAQGIGLNSAIHDAYELASRIALALGGADDSVLGGYERRRRRAALEVAALDTDPRARLLRARTPAERDARAEYFERAMDSPRERRHMLLRSSMLA